MKQQETIRIISLDVWHEGKKRKASSGKES